MPFQFHNLLLLCQIGLICLSVSRLPAASCLPRIANCLPNYFCLCVFPPYLFPLFSVFIFLSANIVCEFAVCCLLLFAQSMNCCDALYLGVIPIDSSQASLLPSPIYRSFPTPLDQFITYQCLFHSIHFSSCSYPPFPPPVSRCYLSASHFVGFPISIHDAFSCDSS